MNFRLVATRATVCFAILLGLNTSIALAQYSKFGDQGKSTGGQTGDGSTPFTSVAGAPVANQFVGTASTSIPIVAPPGRGKMTPQLSLEYSSSAGRSAFGYGWTIPISKIERSTKDGVPTYRDDSPGDEFVLNMGGQGIDLVRTDGLTTPFGSTMQYKPLVDSLFGRIVFSKSGNSWKLFTKEGEIFSFGPASSHRRGRGTRGLSTETAVWLLESVEDAQGNTLKYTYQTVDGQPSELLQNVVYGGNTHGIADQFAVTFTYTTLPYVAGSSYAAGFQDRITLHLNLIDTRARWPGNSGGPETWPIVREYAVNQNRDSSGTITLDGVALTAYGSDGAATEVPEAAFHYASPSPTSWPTGATSYQQAARFPVPTQQEFGRIHDRTGDHFNKARFDLLDMNGDSILDHLEVRDTGNGDAMYFRPGRLDAQGRPSFGAAIPWSWPASPQPRIREVDSSGYTKVDIFDITGDGRPDLVDAEGGDCGCTSGGWCVYEQNSTGTGFNAVAINQGNGCWADQGQERISRTSNGTLTVDMTGDGRPDVLDFEYGGSGHGGQPLRFLKLYRNTGNGFAPGVDLSVPANPAGGSELWYSSPDGIESGFYDINGDGLRDFVVADQGPETGQASSPLDSQQYWLVFLNQGTRIYGDSTEAVSFSPTPIQWRIEGTPTLGLPRFVTRYENNGDVTVSDLMDMNGDGLPDLLRKATSEDSIPTTCATGTPPADDFYHGATDYCWNQLLFLNTGSGFAPPIPWQSPASAIRADGDDCNQKFTQSKAACFDLVDFDGDSLPDLVVDLWTTEWGVFLNPGSPSVDQAGFAIAGPTKPNLMTSMLNGHGASTHLYYQPISRLQGKLPFSYWVLEESRGADEFSDSAPVVQLSYERGRYDGTDRDFRGFGRVWAVDAVGRGTVTDYHQDKRRKGSVEAVTTIGSPLDDCTAQQVADAPDGGACNPWNFAMSTEVNNWGSLDETAPFDDLFLNSKTTYLFNSPDVGGTCAKPNPTSAQPWMPVCGGSRTAPSFTRTTESQYDCYRNEEVRTVKSGSTTISRTRTTFDLKSEWGAGCGYAQTPGRFIVSRPKSVVTTEGNSAVELFRQEFTYLTGSAAVDTSSTCRAWDGGCNNWSTTSYGYDGSGNVIRQTSPFHGHTWHKYEKEGSFLYPTETTTPSGLRSFAAYLPGTGQAVTTIDANRVTKRTDYDGLGRPTASWTEPVFTSVEPETIMYYAPPCVVDPAIPGSCGSGGQRPGRVETYSYTRDVQTGSHELATAPSYTFYDGLSRVIATKSRRSTFEGTRVVLSDLQKFDPHTGAIVDRWLPFVPADDRLEYLDIDDAFSEAPDKSSAAHSEYDFAGRLISLENPDGATTLIDVGTVGYKITIDANLSGIARHDDVTAPVYPGRATIEQRDPFGRVVRTMVCSSQPTAPTACNGGALLQREDLAYDGLDRVVVSTQYRIADGSTVTALPSHVTSYDGLGEVASTTDPDTGTYSYSYNPRLNIATVSRPDRSFTRTHYDVSGRVDWTRSWSPTLVSIGSTTPGKYDSFTSIRYGKKAKRFEAGRVKSIVAESYGSATNADSVVTKQFTYNPRGSVLTQYEHIRTVFGDPLSYTTVHEYDASERLIATTYPRSYGDELGSERVEQKWNEYGQLYELSSPSQAYVKNVQYDIYGNARDVHVGDNVHDILSYGGPKDSLQLRCARIVGGASVAIAGCENASSDDLQAVEFDEYDRVGRVKKLLDGRTSAVSSTSPYKVANYDSLGRLTSTQHGDNSTEHFTYDTIGNILDQTRNAGTPDSLYRQYEYGDASRPHRATAFASATPNLVYSPTGNLKQHGVMAYDYDSMGRLLQVRQNGNSVEDNVYDEAGQRVVRDTPNEGARYYFAGGRFEVTGTQLTRYFFLGSVRVAVHTDDVPADLMVWSRDPESYPIMASISAGGPRRPSPYVMRQNAMASSGAHARTAAGLLLVLSALGIAGCATRGHGRRVAVLTATVLVAGAVPMPKLSLPGGRVTAFGVPVASADVPNDLRFFHVDYLGSPTVITKAGDIVEQLTYWAYGDIRGAYRGDGTPESSVVSARTFTGHERDSSAKLLYMGARHYDPDSGLFLTPDPKGQYASPYTYGGHNPYGGTDPDGQWFSGTKTFAASLHFGPVYGAFVSTLANTGDIGGAIEAGTKQLAQVAISLVLSVYAPVIGTVIAFARMIYGIVKSAQGGDTAGAIMGGVMLAASVAMMAYAAYSSYAAKPTGGSYGDSSSPEGPAVGGAVEDLVNIELDVAHSEGQLTELSKTDITSFDLPGKALYNADGTVDYWVTVEGSAPKDVPLPGWRDVNAVTEYQKTILGPVRHVYMFSGSALEGRYPIAGPFGRLFKMGLSRSEAVRKTLFHEYIHFMGDFSEPAARLNSLKAFGMY